MKTKHCFFQSYFSAEREIVSIVLLPQFAQHFQKGLVYLSLFLEPPCLLSPVCTASNQVSRSFQSKLWVYKSSLQIGCVNEERVSRDLDSFYINTTRIVHDWMDQFLGALLPWTHLRHFFLSVYFRNTDYDEQKKVRAIQIVNLGVLLRQQLTQCYRTATSSSNLL